VEGGSRFIHGHYIVQDHKQVQLKEVQEVAAAVNLLLYRAIDSNFGSQRADFFRIALIVPKVRPCVAASS
jgi:hypothetical protein